MMTSFALQATGVMSETLKYKPPEEWQKKFDKLGTSDENVLTVLLEVGAAGLFQFSNPHHCQFFKTGSGSMRIRIDLTSGMRIQETQNGSRKLKAFFRA